MTAPRLICTQGITIGDAGSGGISVQDGANVSAAANIDFGYQSTANGGGLFDSATVNVGGFIIVGDGGSGGLTIQNNATVSAGGGFTIGTKALVLATLRYRVEQTYQRVQLILPINHPLLRANLLTVRQ